jgi:hypothetical protein
VSRTGSGGASEMPTRARSRELRAWIERYLRLGFSVIPVRYLDKAPPLVKWEEYQRRQPTSADVEDWFRRFKVFNVAVVTGRVSRLLVIDFDDYDTYEEWLGSLPLRYRLVVYNFTIRVKTPRGAHVYIRPENPGIIPPCKKDYSMGIDIKGEGGYVVAPPSIIRPGNKYRFMEGSSFRVMNAYLPPLWDETVQYLLESVKRVF